MKKFILLITISFFYTNLFAQGQIINVPTDQPTIQTAINASVDGDTVLVADGTYYENINFRGKAITVASHFLIDGNETHIDSTIINGSQPSDPKNGTVVSFISGEDTTSVLYGLTITGGTGGYNINADHYGGGGIAVASSGGKILYNKIINNSINYSKAYGAGIVIEDPTNNLIIKRNLIANNVLNSSLGRGGGIFCIVYNPGDRIYIIENVIINNSSLTINGGGGISINGANPIVMNNLIKNNYGKYGGGVQYKNYRTEELGVAEVGMPKLNFMNNTIVNNISDRYAGIHSYEGTIGNTIFDALHPRILNNIIWGNISTDNSQIHPDFIVEFSDIEGGYVGHGNIDLDPLFADTTNFNLSPSSPCVDAGIPYSTFNDVEVPNNPSSPLFPALGSLRNDMGAYGGNLKMFSKKMNGIIKVPTNLTTIQSAINVSLDGDTVLVADGRYYENINFNGKAITVASHFLIDKNEIHIDSTIINGSKPNPLNNGTVVRMIAGEDTLSVLYGFTITGGTGSLAPDRSAKAGGGIIIENSGGKIQHNKIIHNTVIGEHPFAAGIFVHYPNSPVIISNNEISYNVVTSTLYSNLGGGVFIRYDNGQYVNFFKNVVSYNSVTGNGNGCGGGGISMWQSSSIIRNNLIKNNKAQRGGGIDIVDNEKLKNAQPTIVNNTIINNTAKDFGGGIMVSYEFQLPLIPMLNNIIWGNSATDDPQVSRGYEVTDHFKPLIEYSNVEGGFEGKGNIDLDPQFADTINFYLSPTSPCVDAGNPDLLFNDSEDPLNTGFALFPALSGLRNDMGHCGGNPKMLDIGTDVSETSLFIKDFRLSQNYPNPFNPSTVISYSLSSSVKSEKANVKLIVFDILGREIATLVNQKQKSGSYEVTWDASNVPSGVYFYKLSAGDFVETKKMILLR